MTAEGGIPDPSVHTRARIDELLAEIKRLRADNDMGKKWRENHEQFSQRP